MHNPILAVLIGAGQRGALDYASYALRHPDQLKFVAVAEPIQDRRRSFSEAHQIHPRNQFKTWEDLLAQPRMADAALICTQDQMHTAPTLAAFRAGYDVLLEKPMATTAAECKELLNAAIQSELQLHICHVLRFTKHFQTLNKLIQSGILGQIIHVDHRENVSWWHMAHSYVRGNWAKEAESCPMILAKCCHDFDILLWCLDSECLRLSSVGNLTHFRPENAPANAPEHCLDGCPIHDRCPYYAPLIYVDSTPLWRTIEGTSSGLLRWIMRAQIQFPGLIRVAGELLPILREVSQYRGWPRSVLTQDPTPSNLMQALRDGPFGRCVYHCGNDVVDHQVVTMEFEGGVTVTLTMQGHSHIEGRTTHIAGALGELSASFSLGGSWIEVSDHHSGQLTRYDTSAGLQAGHSGGDEGLMQSFIHKLQVGEKEGVLAVAKQALDSHLLAFAAEQARKEARVIQMDEFMQPSTRSDNP